MTDNIQQRLKGIPGLMTASETALLIRMARSAEVIVELGCYKGRSLAAMMLANPKADVYGVDSFGSMKHRGYRGATEAECRANLEKLGLIPKGILAMTTDEAAEHFEREIDMLHLDAGHSREEVQADIDNWLPKVKPGGAVVFHDYGKAHKRCLDRPEVKEVVDKWQEHASEWVEVERSGVSIAFRNMLAGQGALLVAYGSKAREGAKQVIRSLREHMPGLPVATVGDVSLEIDSDYHIYHPDLDAGARAVKTRMYSLSPFRKTLYLDADCVVVGASMSTFTLLDYFDVVLAIDPNRILSRVSWPALTPAEVDQTVAEIGTAEVQYYNSGVIGFTRNQRNRRFFQNWHTQWLRWGKQDQMALIRALYSHPVRIAPMREQWNTHRKDKARFVYHKHRSVARKGAPG